ncbi:MAG: NHL repeat-containing protein [Planctomycetota bacterium]|jgi:sugar lactone lactonase YvrE
MAANRRRLLVLTACATALVTGCGKRPAPGGCPWEASEITVVKGFDAPECALADAAAGKVYVGNMVPDPKFEGGKEYWSNDGTGFVSRMSPEGKVDDLRWAASSDAVTFHSPKGLCIAGGKLWAADNTRVIAVDLATGEPVSAIKIEGAKLLNDMVADGERVYVSDTGAGRITRVAPGDPVHLKGPAGANGLAFRGGKLFCVSWGEHEIYEIDLEGKAEAKAVGLADKFANLDGIEALPDGSFLVSDQPNDRIARVSADFKTVETLVTVTSPADFGLDLGRGRIYVPSFQGNCVTIISLKAR